MAMVAPTIVYDLDGTLADTAEDLVASNLLRLCQPARFGGSEQGLGVLCEVLMALGRGDGSQAWVASVYGAMAYQTALFEDQAQHDVWDNDPGVPIGGSLVPVGNRVEKVDGGYRLRLPVFGWYTSKGRSLEANGVDPDVPVEISPDALADGQDNQMTRAIAIVNGL